MPYFSQLRAVFMISKLELLSFLRGVPDLDRRSQNRPSKGPCSGPLVIF